MKKFATFCFALMFVLVVATGCPAKPGPEKKGNTNTAAQGHEGHNHGAAATTEETGE